jgi:uncharacterized protein YkwD
MSAVTARPARLTLRARLTRLVLLAAVAALSLTAISTTVAQAKVKKLVRIDRCASIYADKPVAQQRPEISELAMNCLINRARAAEGIAPLKLETRYAANGGSIYRTPLWMAATQHAQLSVAGKWWDNDPSHPLGWQESHKEPGNPAPFDQQITQRIVAAGFCPGGNYTVAENTFSATGMAQKYPPTPRGAVSWWLDDPPHRAVLLGRSFTVHRIGIVPGLAFPSAEYPPSGTFVQNLGTCR